MSGLTYWFETQILERIRLHALTFARDGLVVAASFVLGEYLRFFPHAIPNDEVRPFVIFLPFVSLVFMTSMYIFGVHRRMWQYAGVRDMRALVDTVVVATIAVTFLDIAFYLGRVLSPIRPMPFAVVFVGSALSLLALSFVRLWPRLLHSRTRSETGWSRVLIVGAGQGGNVVAADLLTNPHWKQIPVGFVDDSRAKRRRRIHNVPVLGAVKDLPSLVTHHEIDTIGIAIPSASTKELDRILALAQQTTCRIQVLPSLGEILNRETPLRLRNINLDDLLNRPPPSGEPTVERVGSMIEGKIVLVTGAAGSIGAELCRQVARLNARVLVALDNNETGLFHLERDLAKLAAGAAIRPVLGDITDAPKLHRLFVENTPHVVFHAAAYKHVPILESNPEEAVFTNVQGTMNVCRASLTSGAERFVFVSTDKAVHPINSLGFSKRLGELLARAHDGGRTIFCSVRFGNVIGSRGSALPEFIRQIDSGGPVLVTHPEAERYFMTIPEAVSLVIQAAAMASGGEIFMLDMGQPVRIEDLARRIIRMRGLRVGADVEIVYTGLRPGEKLTEDLVFAGERARPTENPAIHAVEDDTRPTQRDLEAWLHLLMRAANSGETTHIRATLREAALAHGAPQPRSIDVAG